MSQESVNIEQIIKTILNGDSVAFLGAGFSCGAINIKGEEILTGKGLAQKLCEEMGENPIDDLDSVVN